VKEKSKINWETVPAAVGSGSITRVQQMGRAGLLFSEAVVQMFRKPFRWKLFFKQMEFIGNKSMSVVILTGMFTGMVLALQMFEAMKQFSAESVVGGVVALAITKELGPVLTALMVNSRAGSAIAAEIGTMRVTEQIDALDSMAVNPVQYLISPRIFAGIIMLPFLTMIADFIGVIGGYLIAVMLLGLDHGLYVAKVVDFVELFDLLGGLFKSSVFGLILTFVGCYKGYYTKGGAEGVGNATTQAVVVAAVMILAADYLITSFIV
jgi:phospholipid/cholesterol/gamma-HCH transport system permease protein